MGFNIIHTIQSLLGFLAKARRAGASVAVALLAVAAVPATGWNAASIEAQDDEGGPACLTCTASCLDGEGSGRNCELEGDAAIGGNACKVTINYDDPLGDGDGWYDCWCLYQDGFCWVAQAMAPTDREELEVEAIEAVTAGRMLPADGLFYLAVNSDELVVRWKCDGQVAGRLAAQAPARSEPVLGG